MQLYIHISFAPFSKRTCFTGKLSAYNTSVALPKPQNTAAHVPAAPRNKCLLTVKRIAHSVICNAAMTGGNCHVAATLYEAINMSRRKTKNPPFVCVFLSLSQFLHGTQISLHCHSCLSIC